MALETGILRKMWRFVETSNPYTIVKLSDQEIIEKFDEASIKYIIPHF